MLAGYETTSTALTYITFVIGKYPQEYERLCDEINSVFYPGSDVGLKFLFLKNPTILILYFSLIFSKTKISVDSVQNLQYLDMFLKEVLRHYPIANG